MANVRQWATIVCMTALVAGCGAGPKQPDVASAANSLAKLRAAGSAAWAMELRFVRGMGPSAIGYELTWNGRGDFRRGVAESTVSVRVVGGESVGDRSTSCKVIHHGEDLYAQAPKTDGWVKAGAALPGPDPMSIRAEQNSLEAMLRSSSERAAGQDVIDGTPVTTYELTVDLEEYQRALNLPASDNEGVTVPAVTASIDGDGRPRRFAIDYTEENGDLSGGWNLSFSDFGRPVSVIVPTSAGPMTDDVAACFGLRVPD